MPIEKFTLEQFKEVLNQFSTKVTYSFEMGEYTAFVWIDGSAFIKVRSSIGLSEIADSTGEDSIRLVLLRDDKSLLFKDSHAYITRMPGWAGRLKSAVDRMKTLRNRAGDCPDCDRPMNIFISNTPKNPDRPFCKCTECDKNFRWVDKDLDYVHFSKKSITLGVDMASGKDETHIVTAENTPKGIIIVDEEMKEDVKSFLRDILGDDEDTPFSKIPVLDNPEDLQTVLDSLDDFSDDMSLAVPFKVLDPTPEQAEVIQAPVWGAYRVIAGPGSGKTFTMKYRYRYLLDMGILPDKIMAVTFNAKMADELREKIMSICPEIEGTSAEGQICTIHAFCFRQGKAFGIIPANIEVVDGKTQWKMRRIYEMYLKEHYPREKDRPGWAEAASWVQTAKSHSIEQDNTPNFFLACGFTEEHALKITAVRKDVDRQMAHDNLMTFVDMIYLVDLAIRTNPAFLAFLKAKISHIIVDEGQDTSHQAMSILTAISDNFTVVGDPDQLLYRFAGATPEANLFEGFEERYPNGHLFKLETNHRSTQSIVSASRMIRNNYMNFGGPYDDMFFKDLMPSRQEVGEIEFRDFDNPFEEARFVVATLKEISLRKEIPVNQVAGSVFCGMRTRAYSVYMEDALARAGIPYINTTGMTFWSQHHIQLLLAYFRCAVDPGNKEAFNKIYNVPSKNWTFPWQSSNQYGEYVSSRILSKEFITQFPSFASVMQASSSGFTYAMGKFRPALWDIWDLVTGALPELETSIGDCLAYFVRECLKRWLEAESGHTETNEGDGGKLDDFHSVIEIASMFKSATDFLQYVDNIIASAIANVNNDWTGRVVISTIHKLKGLERDYVFALGVSEYDPEGKSWTSLLPHTFAFVDPPNQGILPSGSGCRMEDERCLYFVLITRAKEQVWICSPRSYQGNRMVTSRFIFETIAEIG